eukprot:1148039-Pelagomonas_calceolata.AAC.1
MTVQAACAWHTPWALHPLPLFTPKPGGPHQNPGRAPQVARIEQLSRRRSRRFVPGPCRLVGAAPRRCRNEKGVHTSAQNLLPFFHAVSHSASGRAWQCSLIKSFTQCLTVSQAEPGSLLKSYKMTCWDHWRLRPRRLCFHDRCSQQLTHASSHSCNSFRAL